MTHEVRYSRQAANYLRRLDGTAQARMREAIDRLGIEPRAFGTKPLKGAAGSRALRVGGWRVVYSIDDDHGLVDIKIIAPRGQVYRRL
ncbi:MAG TPA: type II toxin-antitoxin system RelE/ParE family toxin [Tepidiformaceae bacterium]|nr:type II toxin-antitoxin system RelE/ParE family toxin [Tepidiformaceae bacterium]